MYFRLTVGKHFARPTRERFQVDVFRFTSRALALEHSRRCRRITTQDLVCRLVCLLGIASKLQ